MGKGEEAERERESENGGSTPSRVGFSLQKQIQLTETDGEGLIEKKFYSSGVSLTFILCLGVEENRRKEEKEKCGKK